MWTFPAVGLIQPVAVVSGFCPSARVQGPPTPSCVSLLRSTGLTRLRLAGSGQGCAPASKASDGLGQKSEGVGWGVADVWRLSGRIRARFWACVAAHLADTKSPRVGPGTSAGDLVGTAWPARGPRPSLRGSQVPGSPLGCPRVWGGPMSPAGCQHGLGTFTRAVPFVRVTGGC